MPTHLDQQANGFESKWVDDRKRPNINNNNNNNTDDDDNTTNDDNHNNIATTNNDDDDDETDADASGGAPRERGADPPGDPSLHESAAGRSTMYHTSYTMLYSLWR